MVLCDTENCQLAMDEIPELVPLKANCHLPPLRQSSRVPSSCYQAPLRICRLLALLILVPCTFVLVPLYMRYHVFSSQMYPMGMTDMRLIDGKVSTTWCQRQVVKSNTTFNAFVMPGAPEMASELVPVSMTRDMELEADMKEYWGFYLLQGSTVTVSACVRRPGASLIMIRGYKHLQECAYIGDNSSEEMDELIKAEEMGLLSKDDLIVKLAQLNKADGKANQPDTMKRHKAGVSFHDPSHAENITSSDPVPSVDVTDHDPKELREILEHLHAIRQAIKDKATKEFQLPAHLVAVAKMHRFRDTNIDRDEQKWLTFKDLDNKTSTDNKTNNNQEQFEFNSRIRTTDVPTSYEFTTKVAKVEEEASVILNKTNEGKNSLNSNIHKNKEAMNMSGTVKNKEDPKLNKIFLIVNVASTNDSDIGNSIVKDKTQEVLNKLEEETETRIIKDVSAEPDPDSKEIFEDVLKRLQSLGDRGKRVLKKLHLSMGMKENVLTSNSIEEEIMNRVVGSSEELDRLRRVLVEAIDEERIRPKIQPTSKTVKQQPRNRRELYLGAEQSTFEKSLNEDDEARDYAAEEGLEPDGYAEHHTKLNETSPLDMSNSEFWSSFSSSEEALLECDGLILNLPLTPNTRCEAPFSQEEKLKAAQRNAITYRVPANGYYFFVFNSENEVQKNYMSVQFDLQKSRYDVARSALRECRNRTARCDLALDIFTSQKVVLELPLRNNDSLWNEQFIVISECEPRTSIYMVCVISVPLLFMVFAFQ